MPVTRSSNVMFEEKYLLQGDCFRYDALTLSANRSIKSNEELLIDYGVDCQLEKLALRPTVCDFTRTLN